MTGSIYVASIRARNFLCYRELKLDLGPLAYAVVGRHEDDPDASNLAGKTALVEAIRFALYGVHRHRLEDDWISRGAAGGEVELRLSDGSRVMRSRVRGKPGRLLYAPAGVSVERAATQAEAQRQVEAKVGLSAVDFSATCFFEQKRTARFVVADPEERHKIIAGWLELAPLVAAEDVARTRLARVVEEGARYSAEHASLWDELRRLVPPDEARPGATIADVLEDLRAERQRRVHHVEVAKAEYDEARGKLDDVRALSERVGAAVRYRALVERGRGLVADFESMKIPSEEEVETALRAEADAIAAHRKVEVDLHGRRLVARGKFDGKCPVVPIDCPAKARINRDRETAAEHAAAAEVELESLRSAMVVASGRYALLRGKRNDAAHLQAEIDKLRGRAKELKKAADAAGDLDAEEVERRFAAARAQVARAEAAVSEATSVLAAVDHKIGRIEAIGKRLGEIAEERRDVDARVARHREAVAVLGKNGAQRRVAEAALSQIEASANQALEASEAIFRVAVRWSREGRDPAKWCEECGTPFVGARAKECGRCGAPRGLHVINRLEVELTDRSGAAEDLAGIHVQLAAATWLRQRRGTAFASVVLDEPTAAFDRKHRRALARTIGPMLSGYGFAQAFVSAHAPDAIDHLPGRIEVVSDGKWSTARVV